MSKNSENLSESSLIANGIILGIKNSNDIDVTNNPPIKTSFAFTGREMDWESGLYYYRARYYDSSVGRFLQEDPHPGELSLPITVVNRYAYTGNNPINFPDPSGKFFFAAAFAFGAMIAGGATATGALAAIGAAFIGSMAAGALHSAITGNWNNFWSTTESVFNISAGFLGLSALAAWAWGGGVKAAGANSIFQGYVQSNATISIPSWVPFIGGNTLGGGLTIGTGGLYSGVELGSLTKYGTTYAVHELGHTVQYIGLVGGSGTSVGSAAYLGLGVLGLTPYGAWWEHGANAVGF